MGAGLSRRKPDPWASADKAARETQKSSEGREDSIVAVTSHAHVTERQPEAGVSIQNSPLIAGDGRSTHAVSSHNSLSPIGHDGDDFSVYEDDGDNYHALDLEQIEAEYRAARARAIFSAGAATRVAKLERMKAQAEQTVKRDAELAVWREKLEMKATLLHATLLEQRTILTWGPVAIKTGRLNKTAVKELQDGIRDLNETVEELEALSRLNTPRTEPDSGSRSSLNEGPSEHRVESLHLDWPRPSTKPDILHNSSHNSPRTLRRPWSWKGRKNTAQRMQRIIAESINAWNPAVAHLVSAPLEGSRYLKDTFTSFFDTPRSAESPADPLDNGEDKTSDGTYVPEGQLVNVKEDAVSEGFSDGQLTGLQDSQGERIEEKEEPIQNLRKEGGEEETAGREGEDELPADLETPSEQVNDQPASFPIFPNSIQALSVVKSPASIQQSFLEEGDPIQVIHQMWSPTKLNIEHSPDVQTRVRLLSGVKGRREKLKNLQQSRNRLPRILGLQSFQDTFEMHCNLSHAADYTEENERLASDLRKLVRAIRPRETKKKFTAAVRTVQTINMMKRAAQRGTHELLASSNEAMDEHSWPAKEEAGASHDTMSDQILELQDELTETEATFRNCEHCAGHFTRDEDRRGPAPEVPEKKSVEKDLEKLAYFAANVIRPTLRDALSAAVTASYGTSEANQIAVKDSVLQQLECEQNAFFSTKLRTIAELPPELAAEVELKRSKARSQLVVNLKHELIAYQNVAGTELHADLHELEQKRKQAYNQLSLARQQCAKMRRQLGATLKIQGLWRGVSCREGFRKKGIHITSPLEEYARTKLLPELTKLMGSKVAVRRERDSTLKLRPQRSRRTSSEEYRIFAGMVDDMDVAKGWGCIIFSASDPQERASYFGEFVDGCMHGLGVLSFKNGNKYEGQFEANLPNGYGVEYYASGAIFQGQFQKHLRHGLGVYSFPSGLSYGGGFSKGNQHGEGVEYTELPIFNDPARPFSSLLKNLSELSKMHNEYMDQGERAMDMARDLASTGDHTGAKEMMDRCKTLMNKAFDSSEEMRRVLHAQDDSGRTLVKFVRGNKIIKEVVDPNALATEILVGGWVELNIDPSDPCLSESKTPDKTEILSVQSDTLTEETSRHSFFEEFPDAADGPLQPGEPALVVATKDMERPFSLFQIKIKTEDDVVWWYQKEALRPGHPSERARQRRDTERYEQEMLQREIDEVRTEDIMVRVSGVLACAVDYADLAREGGAQTGSSCSELLQAMQMLPSLMAVEEKTHGGAEFLRALNKHRELMDLEQEEMGTTAQASGDASPGRSQESPASPADPPLEEEVGDVSNQTLSIISE